jgi:hypothetical protein
LEEVTVIDVTRRIFVINVKNIINVLSIIVLIFQQFKRTPVEKPMIPVEETSDDSRENNDMYLLTYI